MTLCCCTGSIVGEVSEVVVAWSIVGERSWLVSVNDAGSLVVAWSIVGERSWLVSVNDAGSLVVELGFKNGLRLICVFFCCGDGCEDWSNRSNGLSVLGFLVKYWYSLRIFRMLSLGISLSTNSIFLTESGDC